jgi:hypothetical protein
MQAATNRASSNQLIATAAGIPRSGEVHCAKSGSQGSPDRGLPIFVADLRVEGTRAFRRSVDGSVRTASRLCRRRDETMESQML